MINSTPVLTEGNDKALAESNDLLTQSRRPLGLSRKINYVRKLHRIAIATKIN